MKDKVIAFLICHQPSCSTILSGRHPVSKDVNRIMKNFFDEGAMVVSDPDGDAKEPHFIQC